MTHISNIIFFAPTSLKTTIIAGVTTGLTGLWNNCTGDWQSFWCECCFHDIMQISLQNIMALLCIHPLNLRVSSVWRVGRNSEFKSLMEMTTMSIFYLFISMTFIATYKKREDFSSILFEHLWHTVHWT